MSETAKVQIVHLDGVAVSILLENWCLSVTDGKKCSGAMVCSSIERSLLNQIND